MTSIKSLHGKKRNMSTGKPGKSNFSPLGLGKTSESNQQCIKRSLATSIALSTAVLGEGSEVCQ